MFIWTDASFRGSFSIVFINQNDCNGLTPATEASSGGIL